MADYWPMIFVAFIFGTFFAAIIIRGDGYDRTLREAPCETFAEYIVAQLPVRCLRYFSNGQ